MPEVVWTHPVPENVLADIAEKFFKGFYPSYTWDKLSTKEQARYIDMARVALKEYKVEKHG